MVTALPHAFYPEIVWRDDLEWAAAELALAGQTLHDPRAGTGCAAARLGAALPRRGGRRRHAQPLRHERARPRRPHPGDRAAPAIRWARASASARSSQDLRAQLGSALDRAAADPSGAGAIYDDFDAAPHTFGLVATAAALPAAHRRPPLRAFATGQRDWALGANAWGASLMIGVGTTFPALPAARRREPVRAARRDAAVPARRGRQRPEQRGPFADGLGEFFDEGAPARRRRRSLRARSPAAAASSSTTSARGRRSSRRSTSPPPRSWPSRPCAKPRSYSR